MAYRDPVLVDLALQGGGAHGAFTWGVLDRLLEEHWLEIDGISGTSAGAMNAAVLVDGHAEGGRRRRARGARNVLARVSEAAQLSPFQRTPARHAARPLDARLFAGLHRHGPDVAAVLALRAEPAGPIRCATSSPTASTSTGSARAPIKLFVTATNVRTGRGRVFRNADDHPRRAARFGLPADTCSKPSRSTASPIGTAAIPAIPPSRRSCANAISKDTILVQINPVERPGTPRTARDILNRLNEVSFNARC